MNFKHLIKPVAAFALICGAPLLQAQVLGGGATGGLGGTLGGSLGGTLGDGRNRSVAWATAARRHARRHPRTRRHVASHRSGRARSHSRHHRPRARPRRDDARSARDTGRLDSREHAGHGERRRQWRRERRDEWNRGQRQRRGQCRGFRAVDNAAGANRGNLAGSLDGALESTREQHATARMRRPPTAPEARRSANRPTAMHPARCSVICDAQAANAERAETARSRSA